MLRKEKELVDRCQLKIKRFDARFCRQECAIPYTIDTLEAKETYEWPGRYTEMRPTFGNPLEE